MKKLVVVLLAVLLAFSLTACGFKNDIKELNVSKGDKMSDSDVEEFYSDLEEIAEEEGDFVKGQWYSISLDTIQDFNSDDEDYTVKAHMSGKYYMSSISYDVKYKIELKMVMEGVMDDEEVSGKATYTITHIKGKTFTKSTYETKGEGSSESETNYSCTTDSYFEGGMSGLEEIFEILSEMGGFDFDVGVNEDTKYYECGTNGIAMKTETSDDYGKTVTECEAVFEKNSTMIKKISLYNYLKMNDDGNKSTIEVLLTMKKASSGSVKAPKDEYLYEERY